MKYRIWHSLNLFLLATTAAFLNVERSSAAVTFHEWSLASGGNGHIYGVTDSASDWQTAEATAVSLGGHLASITSPEEQAFVESTFLVGSVSFRPVWIGLTDRASEGVFSWVTGEPLSFTKWKDGEPNNLPNNGSADEDYVAINWEHGRGGPLGTWNDSPLIGTSDFGVGTAGPYFGLIEIVPIPEPSGVALFGLACCGFAVAWNGMSIFLRSRGLFVRTVK